MDRLSPNGWGAGYDPAMWSRPWWFYCTGAFKATFFGLPLIFLAGYDLLRKGDRIVIAVIAATLLPLPVFSLFAVKQTNYVYPIFPALAFLKACGCVVVVDTIPEKPLLAAIALSALLVPLLYECGALAPREAEAIIALYSLYGIASIARGRFSLISMATAAAVAIAALFAANIMAVRLSLDHRTYYRETADYFRLALARIPPQTVAFVAPEFASLEFYLFRTGE